jgi:ribosome-binding protein aMBF1 (putative translation factor)
MKSKNLENFQKLVSNEDSGWLNKFLHYKANEKWLDNSSKIAVNVMEVLREKGMSQKDLAEKLNVSAQQINKILKGKQNLTFETVGKLEEALSISLMEITEYKSAKNIKTNSTQIKATKRTVQSLSINKAFSGEFIKKEAVTMNVVYNGFNQSGNYLKVI